MKGLLVASLFFASSAIAGVVQPVTSAPQLLIPAAGSTPGAFGTFFHSYIGIANFANRDQNVKLDWLPQGSTSTFSKTILLHGFDFRISADFVAEVLGQSGLGAILITGVASNGDPDPTASLFAQSHIWSPQPGTGGTTAQSIPVIATGTINTPDAAVLFPNPLRVGNNYRYNIGLVNLDPKNEQTFVITFQGFTPFNLTLTVPPMSTQMALMAGSGFPEINIANLTQASTKSNLWVAYFSTIDNITGDAFTDLAVAGAPQLAFPVPIGKN